MEGDIAPFLVRDPSPAVFRPDPAAVAIGPPAVAHMPGDPYVSVGIVIDPVSVGRQAVIKIRSIFVLTLTVLLRVAGIRLNTGVGIIPFPGGIADFRRRIVSRAARRHQEDDGNDPESFSHSFSPLLSNLCKLCANPFSFFVTAFRIEIASYSPRRVAPAFPG